MEGENLYVIKEAEMTKRFGIACAKNVGQDKTCLAVRWLQLEISE